MKKFVHKAESRGGADYGWLKARHSFSFGQYYDPDKMNFGVLRVLNDDEIAGGTGFSKHPHDNMEIITIMLEGALTHEDSMGNKATIQAGEVQIMSAGTGIYHSEKNASSTEIAKLLQIWILPNKSDVQPRYAGLNLQERTIPNGLTEILSPDHKEGLWIHQDAWFYKGTYDSHKVVNYDIKSPENGVYLFLINGHMTIDGTDITTRDGIGIQDVSSFSIGVNEPSEFIIMDVPLTF